MRKRLSIAIVIIMVAAALATGIAAGFYGYKSKDKITVELVTLDDISIPEEIDSEFGLFFYDQNGNRIKSTNKNAPFDKNKPLVIYLDGHPNNLGGENTKELYNLEGWQKGFNTAIFTWKPFYQDDDLYNAETKIWGGDMTYISQNWSYPKSLKSNKYSIAEIFVAYYYDFLKEQGYQGEIRWQGHSLGASLAAAAVGYLCELKANKLIDLDFLPSRITMLDGLFSSRPSKTRINWLGGEIGYKGVVGQVYSAIKKAKASGVAFEFIKSSDIIQMFLNDMNMYDALKKEVCFLDYDANWLNLSGLELEKAKHNLSFVWYNTLVDYDLPIDYAATKTVQYGVSPRIPTSYVYARMGTEYFTFVSGQEIDKDKQMSKNLEAPYVSGFAFLDEDNDGEFDGAANNRIDGIRVELYLVNYDGTKLLGSTLTKNGGYYILPIEPIYITGTNGREFFIKVADKGSYQISTKSGDRFLMNNKIAKNNKSDNFTIYKKSDLIIINIGLTKP
ncbi:MAG: hypothetical protein QM214_01515 [Bacillota bacterium]|nr:hypothetical protein [Bacillota bacterium]HHU43252.1 hypothetical protein [Clostridiales bacterium]